MFDNIITIENILTAWREFLRGKRNRKDVAQFSLHFADNVFDLHSSLKKKPIVMATIMRSIYTIQNLAAFTRLACEILLHHAIYRVLYPVFDCTFIFDSFSCRKKKGTHRALNRFEYYGRKVSRNHTRKVWVLKCDIQKFFANIDHAILLSTLRKHGLDNDTLWLLSSVVNSFHANDNKGKGLPLGNLTGQLLVNIYMNEFDHFVNRKHCD
jgi:RNA-directed DNA polymerase